MSRAVTIFTRFMMSRSLLGGFAASIWLLASASAAAHHSFSMFDMTRTLSLPGTIKTVEITNPHGWIELVVTDAKGKKVTWSIEGAGVEAFRSVDWRKDTVKAGDKVTIVLHPLRNGRNGGALVSIKLADGTVKSIGVAPKAYIDAIGKVQKSEKARDANKH